MKVDFIIDGAAAPAASGATYSRRDPVTGAVASEAAAASEADIAKVVDAAAQAFPAWSETGPGRTARASAQGRGSARSASGRIHKADDRGDRRDRALGGLQRPLRRQHAARGRWPDHPDRRRDHPGRQAGRDLACGPAAGRRRARHRAVERAGDPGRARDRRAARLRQHGDPQIVGSLPGDPSSDRPDHERRRAFPRASSTSSPTRPTTRRRSWRR